MVSHNSLQCCRFAGVEPFGVVAILGSAVVLSGVTLLHSIPELRGVELLGKKSVSCAMNLSYYVHSLAW
ncbi:hypothetical protein [Paenibacillus alvei]|uniref:hypothetical protein n=1 Tax=Paenibacillus alvei TaxID=44250 RepID=UPI001F29A1E1|nr:hypothetical protein [Paenibacillus alvei]